MDETTHMIIEFAVTFLGSVFFYFLRKRDDEQEGKIKELKASQESQIKELKGTITDLYEKHNSDVTKLHELQLKVVEVSANTGHLEKALDDIKMEMKSIGESINYIRERLESK